MGRTNQKAVFLFLALLWYLSLAVCCFQGRDGNAITVHQLTVDHNTGNEDELRRLEGCGLDSNELRRAKRLGMQQNTRSIGDYAIKGGYTNVDVIRYVTTPCQSWHVCVCIHVCIHCVCEWVDPMVRACHCGWSPWYVHACVSTLYHWYYICDL